MTKHSRLTQWLPPEGSQSDEGGGSAPPEARPRGPAEIPGLGPIRVRALQKAGYITIASLRDATPEQLASVPGLSDVKAQYIHDYLLKFPRSPQDDLIPPSKPGPAGASQTNASSAVATEAVLTLGATIALLLSPSAARFRPRLQREIACFARLVESLLLNPPTLSQETEERVARRLKRTGEEFAYSTGRVEIDRKTQAHQADSLAETTSRIEELVTGVKESAILPDAKDA